MTNILALDVGDQRVGVALARREVRIALPLITLARQDADFWQELKELVHTHDVGQLVVGLPRGLGGQETAQTAAVEAFGEELADTIKLPIAWQDEALTSVKAESILRSSGKPYQKADIDALAASLILTDYLETHKVSS